MIGTSGPNGFLAVDGSFVYWGGASGVYRADIAAPTPTLVAASFPIRDLRFDGSYVYWVSGGGPSTVFRVAKAGGTPTPIMTTTKCSCYTHMDTDGCDIWIAEDYQFTTLGLLFRAPIAGGPATVLASGDFKQVRVTQNDVSVRTAQSVEQWTKAGTSVGPIPGTNISGFTVDDSYVYWADVVGGTTALYSRPIAGGSGTLLTTASQACTVCCAREIVAVDEAAAYLSCGGEIRSACKLGGAVSQTTLLSNPDAMAPVPSGAYFFATYWDGAAWVLARTPPIR